MVNKSTCSGWVFWEAHLKFETFPLFQQVSIHVPVDHHFSWVHRWDFIQHRIFFPASGSLEGTYRTDTQWHRAVSQAVSLTTRTGEGVWMVRIGNFYCENAVIVTNKETQQYDIWCCPKVVVYLREAQEHNFNKTNNDTPLDLFNVSFLDTSMWAVSELGWAGLWFPNLGVYFFLDFFVYFLGWKHGGFTQQLVQF